MANISFLQKENVKAEVKELEITLSYSTRAGNKVETIHVDCDDFVHLYNVVLAVAQLYPELLQ